MRPKKKFVELEFSDAFLFAAIMEDAETCRQMLERMIDVASLKPGEDFNQLKKSYVIFICTFDPFGRGLYRYTFEERCLEDGEALGDETCKVFLNTKGTHASVVSPELIQFLHFVGDSRQSPGQDVFLQRLHERIAELKHSRRLEERYMLFGEMLDDERKAGREEGREEGRIEGREVGRNEGRNEGLSSMMTLLSAMIADGKESDIGRLSTDPKFVEKMFETYHIEVL